MKVLKIRTPHISKEGRIFSWTSLLYGIGLGSLLPIFPTFVESIINSEVYVGFFYSAMSVSMIIAALVSSYFLRRFSRMKVLCSCFVIGGLMTLFLVFASSLHHLFPLEFIRVFSVLFVVMTLALMVHDFTKSRDLGKTEGVYFLFNNIGWFLGPIMGGVIAKYVGVEPVFIFSSLFLFIAFFYVTHQHLVKKHPALALPPPAPRKKITKNKFSLFWSDKNRVIAYVVSLVLIMWISFKTIAVPLFVADMGYGTDTAGLILSLSILPYILFEVPIGLYGDKHGLRRPIVWGFFILAFCAMAVKISPIFFLDAVFIILGNIGAAFIEPLHDVYFFRHVKKSEEDSLYGVFVTADPLAKFIGPAMISVSLILLPFDWVFVAFGCLFVAAGFFSFLIKD